MSKKPPTMLARQIDRKVLPQGWRREWGKGHMKYLSPDGKSIVVVNCSKTNGNVEKKIWADFRRAGADV